MGEASGDPGGLQSCMALKGLIPVAGQMLAPLDAVWLLERKK